MCHSGVSVLDVFVKSGPPHLSCGVDLRLPRILPLAEHGRGHELEAVLAADEVGRLEEDRRAVVPGHALPGVLGGERTVDGLSNGRRICLVIRAEMARMVPWHDLLSNVAGLHLSEVVVESGVRGQRNGRAETHRLAVDDAWYLEG